MGEDPSGEEPTYISSTQITSTTARYKPFIFCQLTWSTLIVAIQEGEGTGHSSLALKGWPPDYIFWSNWLPLPGEAQQWRIFIPRQPNRSPHHEKSSSPVPHCQKSFPSPSSFQPKSGIRSKIHLHLSINHFRIVRKVSDRIPRGCCCILKTKWLNR